MTKKALETIAELRAENQRLKEKLMDSKDRNDFSARLKTDIVQMSNHMNMVDVSKVCNRIDELLKEVI